MRRLIWAVFLVILSAAASAPISAEAQPDLTIDRRNSDVRFVSCDFDGPLAIASLVVRNIGDAPAIFRGSALGAATPTLAALYDPLRLDLLGRSSRPLRIEAGEQVTVDLVVGVGARKRGRFAAAATGGGFDADALTRDQRREIQTALQSLGHYAGAIDGIFGRGVASAIRRFQSSRGAARSGQLSLEDVRALSEAVGRPLPVGASTVEVSLIAAVDPYDGVRERDETNNTLRFAGAIDCS